MSGLGKLDKLAYNLSKNLITEFGGTGKIEINTKTSGGGPIGPQVNSVTTIDNIAITPPSPFEQDTDTESPVASGMVETYVSRDECTTEPIPEKSFLSVYDTNFLTQVRTVKGVLKIIECNPIMGGNSIAMYQLICRGSH